MVQKQKRLKSKYYSHLLIDRYFKVAGKNRKLIIPVELTQEQYAQINEFYELGRFSKLEHFLEFREKVEEIMQKTIKEQVKRERRRFKKYPDKWVELAKPIKINDKELKLYLAIVKMQRLGSCSS